MSSRKPPPSDMEPEDPVEYVNDDDDEDEDEDEDDEDEFIPGMDDDDEEEEEDGAIVPLFDGVLSIDQEKFLHYRGEGFHLASTKSVDYNLLDSATKPASQLYTVIMEGPCDIESVGGNPTNRTMEMTWSVQDARQALLSSSQSKTAEKEEEEEEGKKAPALYYAVHGKQIDCVKGESLELQGGYSPSVQGTQASLVCQVRIIPTHLQVASSAAAAPVAAARVDNEDEDEDEADDGVDYEELIALHEDAGLTVEDLQKKYRSSRSTSESSPSKRQKTLEEAKHEPSEDDDGDDYCF